MAKGKKAKSAKKKKAKAAAVAKAGGGMEVESQKPSMAARSISKKKAKGGAKKKGAAAPPKLSEASLAKAIALLDFGGGGLGGGAMAGAASAAAAAAAAPEPVGRGKNKTKGKKKKGAASKALPAAALEAVEEAVGMCWDPAARALCMPSFFTSSPALAKHMAHVPDPWANAAFCNALVKLVEEHCSGAVMLDLSGNGIKSLAPIRRLAAAAPNVERLSLAGNELKSLSELGHFKQMEQLRVLALHGNAALEKREKEPVAYEKAVRKHFPQLCEIDGEPLSSAMPLPVLGGFVPPGPVGEAVGAFLEKFFSCVDEPGRPELLLAYGPGSVMTLTLNLSGGVSYPQCYKAVNRNLRNQKLAKKGGGGPMADRVQVGPEIAAMYQTLPPTRHSPAGMLLDVWMVTDDLLGVNVTGTFAETKQGAGPRASTVDRPFRRSFLLCPTAPDSEAAAAGWPATVANEHLHIGSLANAPVKPVATAAPPPSAASAAGAAGLTGALVAQFMHATGMTEAYAAECLEGNGWDGDAAFANFEQLRASGQIPPDAFAHAGPAP